MRVIDLDWPSIPDDTKWLIYSTDAAPRQANELYCAVRTAGVKDLGPSVSESEWDEAFSWLKPANQDFAAPDIQHILDHHFRMFEHVFTHAEETSEAGWVPYMFGFIVVTEENWRERGVTAVHCDEDRGKWKVTRCDRIPVSELYLLESVIDRDETFDNVRGWCDDSGNDGPDNQGGPAPVGEWQFAVYCTGPSETSTSILRQSVRDTIPDPRGDTSYPPNEACLQFLPSTLSAESIYEDWPPTYAKLTNESADIMIPQPKTCKLHPSLFVHVGGDRLGGLTYIEIVKMEWNYDIEQPEEALKRLGRESITTVKKCEAEILVDTLEQLARTT